MTRNEAIAEELRRWLERYSPPLSLRANPRAMQDETTALLKILVRKAPNEGYLQWCQDVFEECSKLMKTRAWPTVNELGSACSAMARRGGNIPNALWEMDPLALAARRIKSGEPVGDGYIYGHLAHQLLTAGMVTEDDLKPYRSGLFFMMKDAWGLVAGRDK